MSASNRRNKIDGEATVRAALDHYPTPAWATRALLKHCGFQVHGRRVLECAAGDGAVVNVLADAGAIVDAVELDAERAQIVKRSGRARQVVCGDFLLPATTDKLVPVQAAAGIVKPYDAVISNTPYGERIPILDADGKPIMVTVKGKRRAKMRYRDLAREFVDKAFTLAPCVAFLLRLNWAGSVGRVQFHAKHPADLVVLANRPKFRHGDSDATEYAWWIWREGQTVGTWFVVFCEDAPGRGRPKTILEAGPGEVKTATADLEPGQTLDVTIGATTKVTTSARGATP